MNIYEQVEKLVLFGVKNKFVDKLDKVLVRNKILEILKLETFENVDEKRLLKEVKNIDTSCEILDSITEWAGENGLLKENILVFKDLLNSRLMGEILPRTSEITKVFWRKYRKKESLATEYFYNLSKKSNYIRTDRISKNISFKYKSNFGNLEITINLSKPEKDPKEIALLANAKKNSSKYPETLLCKENEGYMGNISHPGRQNHRIIKLNLDNEDWYFQYSPYIYYNEHSIVFSKEVRPMKIDVSTFSRLLSFIEIFPSYFIGSNADLPIVGGSILNHDHFQAGKHHFAMEDAKVLKKYTKGKIKLQLLDWPLSTIRLVASKEDKQQLLDIAENILNKWINYTNEKIDIIAYTDGVRHNTITPIARYKNDKIELDLVLRNNRTTKEHPLGLFHPHSEHHAIKKENIGLIEVMGLAVLPARLKIDLEKIVKVLNEKSSLKENGLELYEKWVENNLKENTSIEQVYEAVGKTFENVLKDCGVFKDIEEFDKFVKTL